MTARKLFAKIHLWLSIPLGLIISVICFSGAMLVFEKDIAGLLHRELYRVEVPDGAEAMRPSELARRVMEQMPDTLRISAMQYSGRSDEACMVSFANAGRKSLSVNPYTGQVNGWVEASTFFSTMRKLHRWLLDPPPSKGEKSAGKVVVGVTTLIMVIILVSGVAIWVPRSYRAMKNRLGVSVSKGWRRFWYDVHVSLGFYATIFLLVMALTGLTWSFGWYRDAAYGLFGGARQQPSAGHASVTAVRNGGKTAGKGGETFSYAVWDKALDGVKDMYGKYKSVKLGRGNVQVQPDPDSHMRKTDTVAFDTETGALDKVTAYGELPRSQTLKGWFYAFHTGSWGGMLTKTLYFLAALIGGLLPLTGYYLWLKKRFGK